MTRWPLSKDCRAPEELPRRNAHRQLKPKLTSQVVWRYLIERYGNNSNILNTTTKGVVFGATCQFN